MQRQPIRAALPFAFLVALGACAPAPQEVADPRQHALVGAPDGDMVVAVQGEVVTAPLLDVFARGRGLDPADPEQRQRALEALVETIVLAQTALRSELGNKPDVQAEITLARLLQASGRQMAQLRSEIQVGEAELRAYYDQEAARAGDTEYHLAHILFQDEALARQVAERANADEADFDALIAEFGSGAALQARDLGWSNLTQLPESFPEILRQLQDGQTAPVPVQSPHGWHVLRRIASRPFERPGFEQVKEGARRLLTERMLAERVRGLREAAQVQYAAQAAPNQPAPAEPAR